MRDEFQKDINDTDKNPAVDDFDSKDEGADKFTKEVDIDIDSDDDPDSDEIESRLDNDTLNEFKSRDIEIINAGRRRVNQPGKKVRSEEKDSSFIKRAVSFYKNNTMKVLYSILGVLIIMLIIALICAPAKKTKENQPVKETQKTTEVTTEPATEDENTIVPEAADSPIQQLITNYFDVAYVKVDMEALKNYVDDITNIDVNKNKTRQKYIESYENIVTYKVESAVENSFIVFVTYDAKLFNIATLAPSEEEYVVKYNPDNGQYLVHNLTVAETIDTYIAADSKIEYGSELRAAVTERLAQALASDAELKKVYDIMTGAGASDGSNE